MNTFKNQFSLGYFAILFSTLWSFTGVVLAETIEIHTVEIPQDEYSFRGSVADLIVEDSPAIIVALPKSAEGAQDIESELAALNDFVPEAFKDNYVYTVVDSGVIELNKFVKRHIVEVDQLKVPTIILSKDYSDTEPVMASYRNPGSFIEDTSDYFGVKNAKSFQRKIAKRLKKESKSEYHQRELMAARLFESVRSNKVPTPTPAQVKKVNEKILFYTDTIYGFSALRNHFTKPFRKVFLTHESGGFKGNDSELHRNKQQQRIYSLSRYFNGDGVRHKEHRYHENGLLKLIRSKDIPKDNTRVTHSQTRIKWVSDKVAEAYTINHRGYLSDLKRGFVERFTFDDDYRLIKLERQLRNGSASELGEVVYSIENTYKGEYDYSSKQFAAGDVIVSKFTYANGELSRISIEANNGKQVLNIGKTLSTHLTEDGSELSREERTFKDGYLKSDRRSDPASGESLLTYRYEF